MRVTLTDFQNEPTSAEDKQPSAARMLRDHIAVAYLAWLCKATRSLKGGLRNSGYSRPVLNQKRVLVLGFAI